MQAKADPRFIRLNAMHSTVSSLKKREDLAAQNAYQPGCSL